MFSVKIKKLVSLLILLSVVLTSLPATYALNINNNLSSYNKLITANYNTIEIEEIVVTKLPLKRVYIIGENLDTSGMIVSVFYNDNTSTIITDYTLSDFDSTTAGEKTITITYMNKSVSFNVTVKSNTPIDYNNLENADNITSEISEIIVTKLPDKRVYEIGNKLNTSGMIVIAYFKDDKVAIVTNYSLSSFDSSSAGEKTVTVSYKNFNTSFTLNVRSKNGILDQISTLPNADTIKTNIIEISVVKLPVKKTYKLGEKLNTSGMIVCAYFDDDTIGVVTKYNISGFNSTTPGNKTVTVSYREKTVSFSIVIEQIRINNAKVSGIKNKKYTGKPRTHSLNIKLGSKTLKNGVDYKVVYSKNQNLGRATVKIVGINSYCGTITKFFYILPKKQTLEKLTSTSSGKVNVKWKKDKTVSGYQIKISSNKKFSENIKLITITSKNSLSKTISSLKSHKIYYIKVRAYKTIYKRKYYGAYSDYKKINVK